jgi:mRNA interferase MazF
MLVSHPRIGDVYTLRFEGAGSVQSGVRPGVVFQNDIGNANSPNVVVFPMTSNLRRAQLPTHVLIRAADTRLYKDSVVLCENPFCVPKENLMRYITTLSNDYMKEIAAASLMASGAISFLEPDALLNVWRQTLNLNGAR